LTNEILIPDVINGVQSEPSYKERWSHFLRQPAKVDSSMQRTIHHEDVETVFG
jgi:hypothetical protein